MRSKKNSPSTKPPRQQRSRVIFDSIIEASQKVFADLGFNAATTNKIAATAGVSIGSLYRYFPDKEALIKLSAKSFMENNHRLFVDNLRARTHLPLNQLVEEMIESSVDHFFKRKSFFMVLMLKMYETGMYETVLAGRKVISDEMAKILINAYGPQISGTSTELADRLCYGFHAYMSALLSIMMVGPSEVRIKNMQQDMTSLFISIVKNSAQRDV